MMVRDSILKNNRPEINNLISSPEMSEIERFQNEVLRQILKFQNDLIIVMFTAYINNKKRSTTYIEEVKKSKETFDFLINKMCFKDPAFLHQLVGITTGMMTTEEYIHFLKNSAEYKRRIYTMTKKRIYSHWDID